MAGAKPPRRPPWLIRLGKCVAAAFGGGRLPVSNAKRNGQLGRSARHSTHREALRARLREAS
jgi:hypothetical protein